MSFFKIKPIWKGNSKHKKLSEELANQNGKETIIESTDNDTNEAENDVATFKLKYLGSTVVEKSASNNKNISTEAVKNIIKTAKVARKQQKKLQRVNLAISTKGIAVTDLEGNDILKVSIYRISNCASDATHRQVFSFIAIDQNDTTECHAFYCSKRKLAENVTLTVGKIFTEAYEEWRDLAHFGKLQNNKENINVNNNDNGDDNDEVSKSKQITIEEEKLIDFDSDDNDDEDRGPIIENYLEFDELRNGQNRNNNQWVSFEDEIPNVNIQILPQQKNLIIV